MKLLLKNRRVNYDFEVLDTYISGISLLGPEVKSIKNKDVDIKGGFVKIIEKSAFIYGVNIAEYKFNQNNKIDPLRTRRLLLKKKEIKKINDKILLDKRTVVPKAIFLDRKGLIKIEIAICIPRKKHDKREYEKNKILNRETRELIA